MNQTIIVPNGYNGATIELDAIDVLERRKDAVKLHVYGKPWLIRWVAIEEYTTKRGEVRS